MNQPARRMRAVVVFCCTAALCIAAITYAISVHRKPQEPVVPVEPGEPDLQDKLDFMDAMLDVVKQGEPATN